ncbi:MAG TPA: hypothetical protein VM600_09200 [Actinomycetota bacterium]|nr:hypothetical protein [Actinomycetota bacterium]
MRKMIIAACLCVVALGGCEMRAELSVEDDGSGTFGFSFGIEEALAAMVREGGGDSPFSGIDAGLSNSPVDWKVEEFNERGLTGFKGSFAFTSIADFRRKMDLLSESEGSSPVDADFSLERSGGGWLIRGNSGSGAAGDLFGSGQSDGGFGGFGSNAELDRMLRIQVRITLPGRAGETNAHEVRERGGKTTFIWRPKASDPPTALHARTSGAGGSIGLKTSALALLLLAILAAGLHVMRRGGSGPPPIVLEGVLDGSRATSSTVAPSEDAGPVRATG